MTEKYNTKDELLKANQELQGALSLLGMTMLTQPGYNNSMRSVMFTSHLKQFLNLDKPQFPGVFTNGENVVGKHNNSYYKAKHDMKVYRKVVKYGDIVKNPTVYKMFLFDMETEKFIVKTRKECEDLTEVFGFNYDNEVIDSFKEGDIIPKGTVLYKSRSYDDVMNYGYGINVPMMYTTDPFTSEDACKIALSLQEELASVESYSVSAGVNNNEYLLDLYSDGEGGYKPFPDIGEYAEGEVLIKRPLFSNQILTDFSEPALRHDTDSDTPSYRTGEVLDIDIYCNNPDLKDVDFNAQTLKYLRSQTKFYEEIKETCKEIMNSGYKYSRDIGYLYKRACEFLDTSPKSKWNDDSNFANYEIKIHIRKKCLAEVGQKITARYGNKSVVAKVVPDEDMPYYYDDNGNKVVVKLLFNILAIINRTTAYPLYEMSINFITNKIQQHMMTLKTRKEKEKLLFDIIHDFNEKQCAEMKAEYSALSAKEKDAYIQECIDDRIYIHQMPFQETKPIFFRLLDIYEKYDFLQPYKIFVRKWGRDIPTLRPAFIGKMYILKLKQTSRKGFSVRNTGSVNGRELPERSYKNKHYTELHSSTPIRFGEYETMNFSIAMIPEDIQLFELMYRTSIKGRRELAEHLLEDEEEFHISKTYTSRVAEIFYVILKSLGIEIEFIDDDEVALREYDDNVISMHEYKDRQYFCTDYQFLLAKRRRDVEDAIMEERKMIDIDEFNQLVEKTLKEGMYLIGPGPEGYALEPGLSVADTCY